MNSSKLVLPIAILLVIGIATFFLFRSSEEDVIRDRLDELGEFVSTTDTAGLLGKAEVVSTFQKFFANPVLLDTRYRQARGIFSPKQLAAAYIGGSQSGRRVEVSWSRTTVEILNDSEAVVSTEASVDLFSGPEKVDSGTERLEIKWIKNKASDWVIESLRGQ